MKRSWHIIRVAILKTTTRFQLNIKWILSEKSSLLNHVSRCNKRRQVQISSVLYGVLMENTRKVEYQNFGQTHFYCLIFFYRFFVFVLFYWSFVCLFLSRGSIVRFVFLSCNHFAVRISLLFFSLEFIKIFTDPSFLTDINGFPVLFTPSPKCDLLEKMSEVLVSLIEESCHELIATADYLLLPGFK